MLDLCNNIVLIGGGGHCKSVLDTLKRSNSYKEIVITDKEISSNGAILDCRVVGDDDVLPRLYEEGYKEVVITLGSLNSTIGRRRIFDNAKKIGFDFPVIIDSTAVICVDSKIGIGVFVGKNAVVNAGSYIGRFAIINTGAIVEHDCRIGEFTHVAVGAVICGGCNIGSDVFVGANATVIQGVKIGMNSIIGAGSVVLADVPENTTVYGVWGANRR